MRNEKHSVLRDCFPYVCATYAGKGKKKSRKKSEFDDFFETAPTEEQWLSGVSAAAMDTDADDKGDGPAAQTTVPAAGGIPSNSHPVGRMMSY